MEQELRTVKKPPLGVTPRYLWEERRVEELGSAIARYILERMPIPQEWIDEYHELVGEK